MFCQYLSLPSNGELRKKVNSHTGRKINSYLIKPSNLKVLLETVLAIIKEGIRLPKFLFGEKKRKTTKFYDF